MKIWYKYIKPYLPFTDSHPDALGGFADEVLGNDLTVIFSDELKKKLPNELIPGLEDILAGDPRPHYHNDPDRVYGFEFAGSEIKFTVENAVLTVIDVQ